jgi:hypothetical protein
MNPDRETAAGVIAMPSRKTLLLQVLLALCVAAVVIFLFVLPAEYQIDPTHFGKLTGLIRMGQSSALATNAAHFYSKPFRTDTQVLTLGAGEDFEYKVRMKTGDVLVYSWKSDGPYEYDFHGESDKDPDHAISYKAGTGQEMYGSLIAPYTGIHGWYWNNKMGKLNGIRLKMAGTYELIEDFSDPDEIEAQINKEAADKKNAGKKSGEKQADGK